MNTFREAMRSKDFVLTASLPILDTYEAGRLSRRIADLAPLADGLHVEEDRTAAGSADPLAVAAVVAAAGADAVLHIDARDRNRLALRASLSGAALLGVTSIVLSQGTKLPDALRGKVKGVFDTNPGQLLSLAREVSDAEVAAGRPELYSEPA